MSWFKKLFSGRSPQKPLMEDADFSFIEAQLGVVLPEVFKEFVGHLPAPETWPYPVSVAEVFAIQQLALFAQIDFYDLQPELKPTQFVSIGGNGCGDEYCMVGNDAASDALWLWEHDPYNGFVLCEEQSLSGYLKSVDPEWLVQPMRRLLALEQQAGKGCLILRADRPYRSVLERISIDEWLDYVVQSEDLKLDEHQEMTNPFTQEKALARSYPGRAALSIEGESVLISYVLGCLQLHVEAPTEAQVGRMQQIAEALQAKLN